MGIIKINIEDENGELLEQFEGNPHDFDGFLHSDKVEKYQYLSDIDMYGDTTFNRLQVEKLIKEIERIPMKSLYPKEKDFISRLKELAEICAARPHQYLKFYGD